MKKKQPIAGIVLVGAAVIGLAATIILGGCLPAEKEVQTSVVDEGGTSKPTRIVDGPNKPVQTERPSPPDLTDCTRIEIKYYPSSRWAFGLLGWQSILSAEENRYIESLETIVVSDPNRIKAIAEILPCGAYEGSGYVLAMEGHADVVCYRGKERLTSFAQYYRDIRTQDGHWFRYKSDPTPEVDPPEALSLSRRGTCATNLHCMGYELRTMAREGMAWPAPTEWCDVLPRRRLVGNPGAADRIAREFVCPGGGQGKCHYAMNPACRPDSPPDMVLLFETKAGWNQHGGKELFTFDNHDPKGGLVLLNDGTVKFIRTGEELTQLRWDEWSHLLKIDNLLGDRWPLKNGPLWKKPSKEGALRRDSDIFGSPPSLARNLVARLSDAEPPASSGGRVLKPFLNEETKVAVRQVSHSQPQFVSQSW